MAATNIAKKRSAKKVLKRKTSVKKRTPFSLADSNIKRVGVEIEGGWTPQRHRQFNVGSDGSVNFRDRSILDGEIRSNPFTTLNDLAKWMIQVYPEFTNSSCGLHIHVSTTVPLYTLLMDVKFNLFFRRELKKWGDVHCKNRKIDENVRFWNRFNGRNSYCRKRFIPESQVSNSYDRYTALNFCAYGRHGTLECRLFPSFQSKLKAVKAVVWFVKLVDFYIQHNKRQPIKLARVRLLRHMNRSVPMT